MKPSEIESLFLGSLASAKFFRKITGTYKRFDDDHDAHIRDYAHGLENDQLFVIGWVKSTVKDSAEIYYFNLPYIDALGNTLAQATWDETNIYFEWPWDGSSTGNPADWEQLEWTLLCMIV